VRNTSPLENLGGKSLIHDDEGKGETKLLDKQTFVRAVGGGEKKAGYEKRDDTIPGRKKFAKKGSKRVSIAALEKLGKNLLSGLSPRSSHKNTLN